MPKGFMRIVLGPVQRLGFRVEGLGLLSCGFGVFREVWWIQGLTACLIGAVYKHTVNIR